MGKGAVLVIGGGIAGIQASLDLAQAGFFVHLVEKGPAIGGLMCQLDKTFPTNDCSMCILSPKLVDLSRDININLLTMTEVLDVSGDPGAFKVRLKQAPRYVDLEKCVACGQCAEKCPRKVSNPFDLGLSKRKAIYLPYPQAVPRKFVIDAEHCIALQKPGRCGFCAQVCPSGAIDFSQKAQEFELEVGALILAPGAKTYDPSPLENLGYQRLDHVLTAHQFERILSASGPTGGHLYRPADGKVPKKIAWLQCVGSRDVNRARHPYCSTVCCMYALKQALLAQEHAQTPLETAIFYTDIRAMGKGFEAYLQRAQRQGVRLERTRVHTVLPSPTGLYVCYQKGGQIIEEPFDLVVLSVGLEPNQTLGQLAQTVGISLQENGFIAAPLGEAKPGIFVCGSSSEPKDIPQTVSEASAAAALAEEFLAPARHKETKTKTFPPERFVLPEPPRIGVFVCHCGINIASVVQIEKVVRFAASLPDVVYAGDFLFTCSQDSVEEIGRLIQEKGLNRVVVAACSPRTHEPLFQETLRTAGLNPYLFEMANIRDQDAWVHAQSPEKATQKAQELVAMAVNRVRLKRPLAPARVKIHPRALVVGGGLAGLKAALSLADQGFPVTLVERSSSLGGKARDIGRRLLGKPLYQWAQDLAEAVQNHPRIEVVLGTSLKETRGSVGRFVSVLEDGQEIEHAVAILACGAKAAPPTTHYPLAYGKDLRVKTSLEFEKELRGQELSSLGQVVFIQCAGTRVPERPYCSRVCCTQTMEQILRLKGKAPQCRVVVLYRDIRTYGTQELLYQKVREKGVLFVRYTPENPPRVVPQGGLKVSFEDAQIGQTMTVSADRVILATGVEPEPASKSLAQAFKCALSPEGFMLEAHLKLRPVDFATEGIFMAGLCHYPKPAEESMAQGLAAAARAANILAQGELQVEAQTAEVDPRRCMACGTCMALCPYHAPRLEEVRPFGVVSQIDPNVCKGCGNCASACRAGAIKIKNLGAAEIMAAIEGAFGRVWA